MALFWRFRIFCALRELANTRLLLGTCYEAVTELYVPTRVNKLDFLSTRETKGKGRKVGKGSGRAVEGLTTFGEFIARETHFEVEMTGHE